MEDNKRAFKGIWIPKEVWESKELTLQQKVMLVEIDSLDNEKGCYASNKYFSEFFGISSGRVSQVINELIDKGYLNAEYIKEDNQILGRILKIQSPPYPVKVFRKLNRGYLENDEGGIKYSKEGYLENDEDNNIIYNNINNNNNNIYDFLQKELGRTLSSTEIEKVKEWEDNELTRYAVKVAILNGAYTINYIDAIIYNWQKLGIKSVSQAQEETKRHRDKKISKKTDYKPEWFDIDVKKEEVEINENNEMEELLKDFK
nr:MAG: Replication initiator protein A (RepA) N-terminus [Bacteriophage sp.]